MGVIIALTGGSGHMGTAVTKQLKTLKGVDEIRFLLLNHRREHRFFAKAKRGAACRMTAVYGNISDKGKVRSFVEGADYVINLAAVIPPHSDKDPQASYECNWIGAKNIADCVYEANPQPKLIHCSTVALYGHRNYLHPWGRVGDPLLVSPFDNYAAHKKKGERYVMERGIKTWAVLRQTGMLYKNLLFCNLDDGLMFHTCLNVPLEWVSDTDSGRLIRNIIEKDMAGECGGFWLKCYDIGGGEGNRNTGFETFDDCFKELGLDTKKVLSPEWHSIRNFHGIWFEDSGVLEKMFRFQHDKATTYWKEVFDSRPFFRLAKIMPEGLISRMFIKRLLKDYNAPRKWIKDGEKGLIKAYFGATLNVDCLITDWKDYPLLAEGRVVGGNADYNAMRDVNNVKAMGMHLNHGYDEDKPDCELDIEDMKEAARFRGGECISESMVKGDLYTPLKWRCHDGHEFAASPYTVIKAGHWCEECEPLGQWDFDRQAKFSPFYAQVWYDTHARGEKYVYYYDENGRATFRTLE